MNNNTYDEKQFKAFIDTVQFDDAPDMAHRDKLEKKLLDEWDTQQQYGGYVEPVSIYFRRLAMAAGFLIVAGVLFWAIDTTMIRPEPFARHPDKEAIRQIIEEENVSGAEKKKLFAQIRDVWSLIHKEDADGLVSVIEKPDTAYTIRKWAASWLAKFGSEQTLAQLEAQIHSLNITDPKNPLVIAAENIRRRLNLPAVIPTPEPNNPDSEQPGMQSLESIDSGN